MVPGTGLLLWNLTSVHQNKEKEPSNEPLLQSASQASASLQLDTRSLGMSTLNPTP